ncbi:uncharacterized protein [Diadema setosum]|uniref:uncharacterized protein n=1 Tax=Diadema setosum TaxID=31175 RepID=UPI003B3A5B06
MGDSTSSAVDLNMEAENNRFATLTETDLSDILDNKDAKKTKDVIKYALRILESYCSEKGIGLTDVESKSAQDLCRFLRTFYAEVRRGNGELYAKRSLITLRYGLQRHFQQTLDVNICSDGDFKGANDMFKAVLHKVKEAGKGSVRHKDPITDEDMSKIKSSPAVSPTTPRGLQNKVFLDLMLHFCNRGRENLRNMNKGDFAVTTDSSNQRYVYLARDMKTKNHRGEGLDDEESQQGRMYETHKDDCPVESFVKYVSHLHPHCDALWQRPKATTRPGHPWYDNSPVGVNTLANKMSSITAEAHCSKVYTNHCLRATSIHKLDNAGFEARHIMAISGHKSETSIKHYSRVEEEQKRRMSLTISRVQSTPTMPATSTCLNPVAPRPGPTPTTTNVSSVARRSRPTSSPNVTAGLASPHTSPINISSNISRSTHQQLHFHGCKVKIYYQK